MQFHPAATRLVSDNLEWLSEAGGGVGGRRFYCRVVWGTPRSVVIEL